MFILMNAPVHKNNRLIRLWWDLLVRIIKRSEIMGQILGILMYPLELGLTRALRDGPTTEIVICKKIEEVEKKCLL